VADAVRGPERGALIRNLLLAFGTLVVLALILEVAFRVLDLRGHHADRSRGLDAAYLPENERLEGLSRQFRAGSEIDVSYDGDPRGYFGASGGLRYRINRHGFRGPEWSERKQADTLRVMLLGDSFAFGEGVRWEDTLGEQLEKRLASDLGVRVEVINVATSGWNTQDEGVYLSRMGRSFEPDLVLVLYVLNDAGYPVGVDLWDEFRRAYEVPAWLRHSYLASFVYTRIARDRGGRRYVESMVASGQSESERWGWSFIWLERMKQSSGEIGARFAVALFPFLYRLDESHPFRPLHEMVGSTCERLGIPFLDLLGAFAGRDYADLWVHPSDQHPNEEGHRVAADAIARFVREAKLLSPRASVDRETATP
jgi:lysophospholipase L1-like esterase